MGPYSKKTSTTNFYHARSFLHSDGLSQNNDSASPPEWYKPRPLAMNYKLSYLAMVIFLGFVPPEPSWCSFLTLGSFLQPRYPAYKWLLPNSDHNKTDSTKCFKTYIYVKDWNHSCIFKSLNKLLDCFAVILHVVSVTCCMILTFSYYCHHLLTYSLINIL